MHALVASCNVKAALACLRTARRTFERASVSVSTPKELPNCRRRHSRRSPLHLANQSEIYRRPLSNVACQGAAGRENRTVLSSINRNMPANTMFRKLGQSFNPSGIAFTLKVVFKEPHLALPHLFVPDISWIDWSGLRQCGFRGVVFDKDNTLTAPYGMTVWPSLISSLDECKAAFEGRIAILSNSAGLYQYDPDGVEAKAIEDKLGIPVVRHGSKKPGGSAEDLEKYFECESSFIVMVGDRPLTDIVYGNKNGLLTIATKPLTLVGEPFVVKQVRLLEGLLLQRWRRQGLAPINHQLLSVDGCNFVKDPKTPRGL